MHVPGGRGMDWARNRRYVQRCGLIEEIQGKRILKVLYSRQPNDIKQCVFCVFIVFLCFPNQGKNSSVTGLADVFIAYCSNIYVVY